MKYTSKPPGQLTQLRHFYFHIPFCHRICPYCSFYKHTPGSTDLRAFIRALSREIEFYSKQYDFSPATLYLGGGTPSMLSPALLDELFAALGRQLGLRQLKELTFEANPATFTRRKAGQFKTLGISRISLGVQSWDPTVLKTLGREHDPEQAAESIALLRAAGPAEINIDQMFSVPGQSLDSWKSSLHRCLDFRPEHISAYNLTYEEDTTFFDELRKGRYRENPENDADFFEAAHDILTAAGYEHYETSNFALPGHRSLHNQSYWQGRDYLGIGPGAVSTVAGRRWKNLPDTARYIQQIESVGHAQTEIETINHEAWQLERIALMLRTSDGLELGLLPSPERVDALLSERLVKLNQKKLVCTRRGAMVVDSIAAHLLT